ncbi:MAG: response regulator [Terriglobales bacterium]
MAEPTKRALVVDDDAALCRLITRMLASIPLEIVTCGSGAEALRLFDASHFDLVLLDIGLPDMNGLDILAQWRDHNGSKVVVITADEATDSLMRAIRENAYVYLRKPFTPEQLQEIVASALKDDEVDRIEVISGKPDWFELSLPCTREAADRIDMFMRQIKIDLPEEVRDSVSQAFRELLMNAVEWGGGLDPSRRVRISLLRTPRMIQYRVSDPGPGFRLQDLEHAAIHNEPGDPFGHETVRAARGMRPGGLGIMMVKAVADELLYNEKHNEVIFIKYLETPAAADTSKARSAGEV